MTIMVGVFAPLLLCATVVSLIPTSLYLHLRHSQESMRHTTESVCTELIKPATVENRVPFTSLGPPAMNAGDCGRPTHFVSHSWGYALLLATHTETIGCVKFL